MKWLHAVTCAEMAVYASTSNEEAGRPAWFGRRAADDPAALEAFAASFGRDGGAALLRRAARGEVGAPLGARSLLWKARCVVPCPCRVLCHVCVLACSCVCMRALMPPREQVCACAWGAPRDFAVRTGRAGGAARGGSEGVAGGCAARARGVRGTPRVYSC